MYDLSIVIPAYNEEKKIISDIEAVYKFFKENSINGELIIVNDGSKDKTFEIASGEKSKYPSLEIITYKTNRGKGYALRQGMVNAKGKHVLFADSGLCVPYKCVFEGIKLLENGADIAIGSRRTKNNDSTILIPQPLYRRIGSKVFYFLMKIFGLIPKGIFDTQCGFKVFKKDVAHKIYSECFTNGFMIDLEMIKRGLKLKYKIEQFPVTWSNDADSRYKPVSGSFKNMVQILKIMFLA